ncbi:MAG: hypothetical protein F6K19_15460 [Cyanothece sp. SIO1E1]|nr:hypothetical protein [Cyanothece sp. SIO1E1]
MYANSEGEFFASRPETPEEREVYDYVRYLARQDSPDKAIDDFYRMLFQGNTYPVAEASEALAQILHKSDADKVAPYFINRCFYTIGNLWQLDTTRHHALRSLITRAEKMPMKAPNDRIVKELLRYVRKYVQSDLYVALKRQMHLLQDEAAGTQSIGSQLFGEHFKDYFFIYESAATTRDIPAQHRQTIRTSRQQRALALGQEVRQYWEQLKDPGKPAFPNPTRIPNAEMKQVIWSYQPERENSYQAQAIAFNQQQQESLPTMGAFKDQFHQYVLAPLIEVDSKYARNKFSHLVRETMAPCGNDTAPLNDISINLICQRFLQLFVSNTIENPKPGVLYFQNLLENVGHQAVTAALLKIVLFRRVIRSWFEDRFSILFHLWEHTCSDVNGWLVQAFEHMNVALALNASWVGYIDEVAV